MKEDGREVAIDVEVNEVVVRQVRVVVDYVGVSVEMGGKAVEVKVKLD